MPTHSFLQAKIKDLAARASRLAHMDHASVGIRPQDVPFAPSAAHFRAANARLAKIDGAVRRQLGALRSLGAQVPYQQVLHHIALVEREIDRSRRAFGLFFEVFSQRGSTFAPALAAHDAIAVSCYDSVRTSSPDLFRGPLLKPVSYMEHGFSPATMRRGVVLNRLLGEPNPFPVIRIPWDRESPWQAVFLHEVAHNLQADLGIWQENRRAVVQRALGSAGHPVLARIYGRWHKEIFADLAAILLGGPAAAWGMASFLAHPATRVLSFRPTSAHPTAYLRVFLLAEMLQRMGFGEEAARLRRVWGDLYGGKAPGRIPPWLVGSADRLIPQIVDEIAFQPRRNLAQRALADVMVFRRSDQRAILAAARRLARGVVPTDLPPRFLVSAGSYALESGAVAARELSHQLVHHLASLNREPMQQRSAQRYSQAMAAMAA
jgi:hypothetical protein